MIRIAILFISLCFSVFLWRASDRFDINIALLFLLAWSVGALMMFLLVLDWVMSERFDNKPKAKWRPF